LARFGVAVGFQAEQPEMVERHRRVEGVIRRARACDARHEPKPGQRRRQQEVVSHAAGE
jgi:hypothetical protein